MQINKLMRENDREYWVKLKTQLQEKTDAFKKSETVPEMADTLEVIDAICTYRKFYATELTTAKEDKTVERGAFITRVTFEKA